ncbi:MAG: TonB-dependent receptor [Woeseiaceae bacterium]|nr:TonB-dependent receptor [Woeseiaceae bacterium]
MTNAVHNRTKTAGRRRGLLQYTFAATVLAVIAAPASVQAQTAGALTDEEIDALDIEEIIVTAQRREQALQEVPMSISAFTGADLEALQADNLDSLQGAVPNLNLVKGRGSNSSVNAFIRGVGQPDALQSFDPAVGVYLDDVYMSRIQGSLFKLYDIERIEVLRGPQGTLYGKNTPGGAIRLITKTPGDEFEAQAGVLAGDYSRVQARARLAGPVSDDFAIGLSVLYDTRDGFVTDPIDGREYNDEDTIVARVKANWDVSDNVNVVLSADYAEENVMLTLGRSEVLLFSVDLFDSSIVPIAPAPTGEWDFRTSTSLSDWPSQDTQNWGANATVSWDIGGNSTLKSITAYRSLETAHFIDIDATTVELGDVFVSIDQSQVSQEFQLLGDNGDNVNWVAGAYYLKEEVPSHQEAYADDFLLFAGFPISFLRTIDDDLETTSYAVFGQVDWAFADRWSLGLGVRWTREEKKYFRTTSTFSDLLGVADPAFEFTDSDDWSDWTPTITLDYEMSDDVRFYGRIAQGFKSGGFNGRANSAADVSTFDPETVWTAEIGAKTTVADGKVRANYAVFYSQYDDFQARVSVGDGIDFRFPVLNAAELDIKGAEVEVTWLPIDPLALSSQIGYLDSKYGSGGFTGADGLADEPAFSPEWTARFAATWTQYLANGSDLMFAVAANYRDAMLLSVENTPALSEDDYWLMDAMFSWVSDGGRWTISGGVKNLTDEVYRVEGQEFRSVGGIQTAYYGYPRTYTIGVDYRY